MSMRCEDVRPLLAELVYDELDPSVAENIREHLGTCLPCRRHQMAFTAVRADLQAWQPAEHPAAQHMTFIAPGTHSTPPPIWTSRVFQGLAIAASFTLVAFLSAAAVNFQVESGPDGWSVSTSMFAGEPVEEVAAEPLVVGLDQIRGLDSWLEEQINDRGVVTLTSLSTQDDLSSGQWQRVSDRVNDMFTATLVEYSLERDSAVEQRVGYLQDYVASSLDQQSEIFTYTVSNLLDNIESGHERNIFELTQEFGLMHYDTERRVAQVNARLDNLLADVPNSDERQAPEK